METILNTRGNQMTTSYKKARKKLSTQEKIYHFKRWNKTLCGRKVTDRLYIINHDNNPDAVALINKEGLSRCRGCYKKMLRL